METEGRSIPEIHKPGVYAIHNVKTNRYYVGSSVDVCDRLKLHKSHISVEYGGVNLRMSKDIEKPSDVENFRYLILEYFENETITDDYLRHREDYYINHYKANTIGYNSRYHKPVRSYKFRSDELLSGHIKNEHIKENYDRVSITLPKGTKERIKAKGETVNGYIVRVVLDDLERSEELPAFMRE